MAENRLALLRRPLISTVVVVSSLALHGTSALLFISDPVHLGYGESPALYYVLLAASAVLAVGGYLVERPLHFRALLSARLLVLLLVGAPFGPSLTIRLLLLLALFLETATFERYPANLAFCLLLMLAVMVAAISGRAPRPLPLSMVRELGTFAAIGILVAASACAMTFFREQVALYGRKMEKIRAAAEELIRAQMGYLEYARSAEERSTRSERNRLSAELHDALGYTFTNLKMMLEAAKDLVMLDPDKVPELLQTALQQVQQGMTETRKALYLIRERHDAPLPFLASVHRMIQVFRKATGVDVVVDYANFPADSGEAVESALYHFIQEGLVNSFSHGKASEIRVVLWADAEKLQVTIEDNGTGTAEFHEGIGIRGMRERLGGLGGTLRMRNTAGGFRITAQVPAPEEPWND